MLEVSQGEASGAGDDEVENRPAKTEAAGLAGEATDHFGPAFDLTQRALEQVGAAQSFAQPERVTEVGAESRQVFGQASRPRSDSRSGADRPTLGVEPRRQPPSPPGRGLPSRRCGRGRGAPAS